MHTIHIYHTYKIFVYSYLLHNQSLQKLWIYNATLQQNNYIIYSFYLKAATMNKGQVHLSCCQPVEFHGVCHHMKFGDNKSKWSIFAILSGLLCSHLPYTINHHKVLATSCYLTEWMHRFNTVALSEGHVQSNCYQTVHFSCVYQHWKKLV